MREKLVSYGLHLLLFRSLLTIIYHIVIHNLRLDFNLFLSEDKERSIRFQNALLDIHTNNNRILTVEDVLRNDLQSTWEDSLALLSVLLALTNVVNVFGEAVE